MGIMRGYLLAPSRALHFLLILLGMFVAQSASNAVLVRNQSNYVYPANGDSIGIPMMGMIFHHVVVVVLLLVTMLVMRLGRIGRVIGYLLGSLLSLGYLVQIYFWGDANHYPIGLAQAGVGVLLAGYLYLEYRRVSAPSGLPQPRQGD
jgi:hypothetical protein